MNFDAESPKAYAVKLNAELEANRHDRAANVVKLAQALREWEARGIEAMARQLSEHPAAVELRKALLVRVQELRGKPIDIS